MSGLIAAVYAVLGLVFYPISFGVYQIRVAEALTVLPFVTRAAVPGLFIGCLLANIYGGFGWQDIIFGSALTLIAALLTRMTFHLSRSRLSTLVASIPAILVWVSGLILLNQTGLDWLILLACLGSIIFGLLAVYWWRKFASMQALALAAAVISLAWIATAIARVDWSTTEMWVSVVGVLTLIVGWVFTLVLARLLIDGDNPNVLLAPLPPVLVNAFGVSLYLAPMLGFDYWFSVQMIGVGQLIACYMLGLPLLRLLQKRTSLLRLDPN